VDSLTPARRAANQKAGLSWTCLDYRHTFGSHLAIKGESLYKIATLMGNSPDICRRHYAALVPEALFSSVDFCQTSRPPSATNIDRHAAMTTTLLPPHFLVKEA